MTKQAYKDSDCDISVIADETIAVIGFGIQGRAQALNLRDSGMRVIIGNVDDNYKKIAIQDGFDVFTIEESVKSASIILFLIPDESQKYIFEKHIKNHIKNNSLILFAHGYSLRYDKIQIPANIDLGLLAPRFPGKPIRDSFLNNSGVPAFIDVINNSSGKALEKILAIGSAIGYGRVGMIPVSYQDETELDLFIEHFIGPLFISTIERSLSFLIKSGYPDIISALELYSSGERGSMWTAYARKGIFKALNDNASPTCKYGISSNYDKIIPDDIEDKMENVLKAIKDGSFAKRLELEEERDYPTVTQFFKEKNDASISKIELKIKELLSEYL